MCYLFFVKHGVDALTTPCAVVIHRAAMNRNTSSLMPHPTTRKEAGSSLAKADAAATAVHSCRVTMHKVARDRETSSPLLASATHAPDPILQTHFFVNGLIPICAGAVYIFPSMKTMVVGR